MTLYHCPFCPFGDDDSEYLVQHVSLVHPENDDSTFFVNNHREQSSKSIEGIREGPDSRQTTSGENYIECECGETVLLSDFSSHSDLHLAEGMAFGEIEKVQLGHGTTILSRDQSPCHDPGTSVSDGPLNTSSSSNGDLSNDSTSSLRPQTSVQKHPYSVKDWANVLFGTGPPPRPKTKKTRRKGAKRLGQADLGPHAYEDQMPTWLRRQLEQGAKVTLFNKLNADGKIIRVEQIANETRGLLPVISQLCEQDHLLSKVYLCHPDVQHVVKMAKEGGFCGYRNIQMLVSFIQGAKSQGSQHFPGRIPSILQLQDLIERAWDLGFNSCGRVETGGIRGTRKFIGTPEAQALFQSLSIGCDASAFNANEKGKGNAEAAPVFHQVYRMIEEYFSSGATDQSKKVCRTSLPPLYFQHPGHSLTIIGFERRKGGACNLLVLDPMFKPSPGILQLVGTRFRATAPEKLLKAYRRAEGYLSKHKCFEVLQLTHRVPPKVGWAV